MSQLQDSQVMFAVNVGRLLTWCTGAGIRVRLGEAWRPDWVAAEYAKQGKGSKNSLHIDRLAIDLLMDQPEDYKKAADFWKRLHPDNCWGGDFTGNTAGDIYHFSMSMGGRK